MPPSQLPTSVEEFLEQLSLNKYWDTFKQMGFDELDTLEDINEVTLNAMNVALGHQGKLMRKIKELVSNL